jgi:hypothetical protein
MLIHKPVSLNDIVSVKLTNGDEVIGKFVEHGSLTVTIRQPVIVAIQPVGPQQVSLGFMPFLVSTNDDTQVAFPISALLTMPMPTKPDVANSYRRATGSLEVATPKGLILPG